MESPTKTPVLLSWNTSSNGTRSKMATFLLLLVFFSQVLGGLGALRLATYYGDHMVLQRGPQSAVVWGHAARMGDTVTVTVTDAQGSHVTASAKVAHQPHVSGGVWKVKLPPMTSSGPHTVTANSSEGTVSIHDVLFGDVWLCSGQSNMRFIMHDLINSSAEIHEATFFPNVRYMTAEKHQSNVPLGDLRAYTAWSKPTSATLKSFSAVCWLFGKYLYAHLKQPIGLIESTWGGTPIELWSSPDALSTCPSHGKRRSGADSVLWNAMINPFLPQSIYGVIWYQGENNSGQPKLYSCQFPVMISDWRRKFHDTSLGATPLDFPFGFVQLAPFHESPTLIGGFPPLRWSQTAEVGYVPNPKMPRTFMAVAMDLPDYHTPTGPVHPRYKQDVAARLVLGARAVAYGEKVTHQGPFPQSLSLHGNHVLTVTYENGPIRLHNNKGFEVCCSWTAGHCLTSDHWVAADVTSHTTTTVSLNTWACHSSHVTSVRYEWRESPCSLHGCGVYGLHGNLPAPPFLLPVTSH